MGSQAVYEVIPRNVDVQVIICFFFVIIFYFMTFKFVQTQKIAKLIPEPPTDFFISLSERTELRAGSLRAYEFPASMFDFRHQVSTKVNSYMHR
jgi:hypothetical protein